MNMWHADWPDVVREDVARMEEEFRTLESGSDRWTGNLEELIRLWESFGPKFGSHDSRLIYDYLAKLWVRDKLDQYIQAARPETRSYIEAAVARTDDAFRDSTVERDPGLAARYHYYEGAPGWWWRRTPTQIGRSMRGRFGEESVNET